METNQRRGRRERRAHADFGTEALAEGPWAVALAPDDLREGDKSDLMVGAKAKETKNYQSCRASLDRRHAEANQD